VWDDETRRSAHDYASCYDNTSDPPQHSLLEQIVKNGEQQQEKNAKDNP
jgi:hypothetical protein